MMSEASDPDVSSDDPGINSPRPKESDHPATTISDSSAEKANGSDAHSESKEEENEALNESNTSEISKKPHQNGQNVNGEDKKQSNHFDDISNDFATKASLSSQPQPVDASDKKPVELKHIHIGDPKVRSRLRFEVVTARVIETGGKKHVAYTIMMKRVGFEPQPAVIERRYSDFCFIYECILRSFHPSILGDFQFPKKVLLGNFKAEVISERTDAFHKFLNLIANCNNLLYSDYFYSFLSSEEHNEAVSHIKLARYSEAIPLLETIFNVREKLLTLANVHVVLVLCELVACLSAENVGRNIEAFSYALLAWRGFELVQGHPDVEPLRVSFLKLCSDLAADLGQDKKPYDRQLSELRYNGVRIQNARPLLEIIRDRYIHRASHTSKIS